MFEYALIKIKGVQGRQIVLKSNLALLTAEYEVRVTGSYKDLEKAVYKELDKKSKLTTLHSLV